MKDLQAFYKDKRVLITGHTGFKGSWLTIWLNELGAKVIGIALDPDYEKNLFNLAGLSRRVIDYRQDIKDLNRLKRIFAAEQPEIVFHLAAQALVIPGYEDPVNTFSTNIMGTASVLEACRSTKSVKQIIIVTTDKVYENKEVFTGYKEDDSLGGHDPYSASKAAAEIVTQSYRLSFAHSVNQSIASARAGNVIGGGDWSRYRLVPDCIRSLDQGEIICIRNPESIRPWQHVLEPLYGYLLLAMKMSEDPCKYSEAWNFGPDKPDIISVKELVNLIIRNWGEGIWQSDNDDNKPFETNTLKLSIAKSKQLLKWRPLLSINEAVELTVKWYKDYFNQDVYNMCANQVKEYSVKWSLENLK